MKKFLLIFALGLLIVPFLVFAQAGQQATDIVCNVLGVVKTIVSAIGFGIVIIFIIVAGIKYITAGGDEGKTVDARKGIQNALIGLVIVVSAYLLISLAQGMVSDVNVGGFQLLTDPCGDGISGGSIPCQYDFNCPGDLWCVSGICR